MAPTKSIDVEDVLGRLTIAEKISLLSGVDNWHLAALERFGIPSIRTSDGPNGVRGTRFFNGTKAACLPCGTGLAATFDVDQIRRGGELQGEEAIGKGASVLLGPTTNMQRAPLGGRGFESFSEDPVLAGEMAAATVNGIQSKGIAATIKHFVCNDQEHERMIQDSRVSERALREIYTMPFQIAQLRAKPWAYMTSYNSVNGLHASENPHLLKDILRGEWGFDGMVMSDWFGTYSAAESIKAGLDLEMPGPTYVRGRQVSHALMCGKLTPYDIDRCVREILKLINKVLPLGIPSNAPEKTIDTKETAAKLRDIASSAIVLLKNENSTLPFKKEKSLAVIGPNAKIATYSGGGSASLDPYYTVTPYNGISAQASGTIKYTQGCIGYKRLPLISDMVSNMVMKVYDLPPSDKNRKNLDELKVSKTDILLFDYKVEGLEEKWYADLTGQLTPEAKGDYDFSLCVAGTAKLFVEGKLVIDNATKQTPGDAFFGSGSVEEYGTVKLEAGKSYDIHIEYGSLATSPTLSRGSATQGGGLRIGCAPELDPETELEKAVELAKEVDQVVLCVGLNADWESEGYDRSHMDLPGLTDRLIEEVLSVNSNTAIVNQSGTPVTMPWATSAPAIMQAWYGGNETGNAIADVLFGDFNPTGKLPLSFPIRVEDNPAFLNYRSEAGRTIYGEDVYIGYRYYEKTKKPVLFPFGHGLSYTTFMVKNLRVSEKDDQIIASVDVTNTGSRSGSHVVQAYVSQQKPSINRPVKELKGFAKVKLEKGKSKRVEIPMSKKYATSFWDERRAAWVMEKDTFDVLVGSSSADEQMLKGSFEVKKTTWWNGL